MGGGVKGKIPLTSPFIIVPCVFAVENSHAMGYN